MRSRTKGTAAIELALMMPILLLLTLVTTEFGRAIIEYNTVVKSVRNATRYLAARTPNTKTPEAKNLVVFGNTIGTGPALAPGLSLALVANPVWQMLGSNPTTNMVTLTVQGYRFNSLFTSVFGVSFGNVTFGDISASMRSAL
jgi:Flp pilus assembly protein TadG